jgi:Flp pilus assembly protein TadD
MRFSPLLPLLVLGCTAFAAPKQAAKSKASPTPKPARAEQSTPAGDDNKTSLAPADFATAGSAEAQETALRAMRDFRKGDLAAARAGFEKALILAPNNPAIMVNLGLIAYRERKFAEAEERLRSIVRHDPDTALAWLLLGIVYYDQEKLDHALAALAQAVLLAPKDARAHHYLGVTIGRKGWYSGAEEEMRKAIELQPGYAEAHFNLAVFYLQRTPPAVELARRHYQKALDLGAAPDPEVAKLIGD